jgi:ABC-type bacteriocin/lantibiotic exporter with double-glycine peptidase domain
LQNPGEGTRPGGSLAVSCERVTYSYPGSGRPALSEVSLDLRQGEYVGVVGPNGGGKSTLVRLLNGLLKPESGRVLITGCDPATEPFEPLSSRMTSLSAWRTSASPARRC